MKKPTVSDTVLRISPSTPSGRIKKQANRDDTALILRLFNASSMKLFYGRVS